MVGKIVSIFNTFIILSTLLFCQSLRGTLSHLNSKTTSFRHFRTNRLFSTSSSSSSGGNNRANMTSTNKKLFLAGWSACGAYQQARAALLGLKTIFPKEFDVTIQECK